MLDWMNIIPFSSRKPTHRRAQNLTESACRHACECARIAPTVNMHNYKVELQISKVMTLSTSTEKGRFCTNANEDIFCIFLSHLLMCVHHAVQLHLCMLCVCFAPCCPWQLGLLFFLISCILNQDHTSHLSDDKCSFGHFCQQAQLQNKELAKSPF